MDPAVLLPAKVVPPTETLLVETVGLYLLRLLVGARRYNGFPPPLTAQGIGAGAEENGEAVLLRHPLQESPQGPVALVLVASVGPWNTLGARQDVL